MARGKRQRLRRNVYLDAYGYAASVRVRGITKEKRFPFGTPLEAIERWLVETKFKLAGQQPRAPRGTLAADLARYEPTIRHLTAFIARRSEARAWVKALGPNAHRGRVTREQVLKVRSQWVQDGVAPKTVNQRLFTLKHWYRTLDGKHVPTPADDIPELHVQKRPAIVIPDTLIREIYEHLKQAEAKGILRSAKTRARFMVFASTGHRQSEIGRTEPGDVDFIRKVWTPRDGKGGFCPGVVLNDDMLRAWELFRDVKAWGKFDTGSFGRTLRAAGLPWEIEPYMLRHTVGITLSDAGHDLQDIADHLGHKRLETTRAHYVPVLSSRLARVSQTLSARALWPTDTLAPTTGTAKPPNKRAG